MLAGVKVLKQLACHASPNSSLVTHALDCFHLFSLTSANGNAECISHIPCLVYQYLCLTSPLLCVPSHHFSPPAIQHPLDSNACSQWVQGWEVKLNAKSKRRSVKNIPLLPVREDIFLGLALMS